VIKSLAHVCFTVRDLDAATAFYTDKLGLRRAFDFVNDNGVRFGVYLHVGGRSFIELFTGKHDDQADGPSFKHICLEVDDVAHTVADLRAKGVEITDAKMGADHSWQAWLADPDGNRIELHGYTPGSWQTPHLK
jgi:catechol 2,3-dioxygenase-like lactoylglutathione lyase family enzyme